ncbi:hypothetical protein TSAR_002870 [Trichomalopsis sarcophagae]|uniref:phospholipase A1 n=1 Tax=Trichomalopsis sarcophagae TaxID=543379 RepID=A0A232FIN8_9HYME|nr:hypothetical protein TSAR_002870 [Trichomalopsis sarcophagae]
MRSKLMGSCVRHCISVEKLFALTTGFPIAFCLRRERVAPINHPGRRVTRAVLNNVGVASALRPIDESLDEIHDAEIFQAVVTSMNEWERKRRGSNRHKREVSRVCYEDVGCFEDTGPFSYLEMLPSPPKDVGTRFFVYGSRKARSIPMEVPAESISEKANNAIDPDLPTKVLVHGFGSSCDHVWVYEMRSALMAVIECNIVCVDWGPGSAVPNYVRAAANTRLVGRQLAKLVRSLNVPLENIHMIGFSLGAHVAGFAGAELGNVSRITGLDPAGPLFEAQDPRARLDETDAQFVDVIHSNGEQLILGGLGSWQPMGDVDFYPNGGKMQSGCSNLFVGAVSDIIWSSPVEGRSLCNHRRAYKLFTDSISPKCRFPAFPCELGYDGLIKGQCFPCGTHPRAPCGHMGFYSDQSPARGQLYLVTRDEEPFCAHQYQVKVYNSRHERPVKSYGKLQVTLIAGGSINETFTMTKKDDEELLVGAILQKIVVPHPTLSKLDAIEVKYTAYSGWISSGLVSWSVDKIAVLDSYGTMFSVCKRGLALESGKSVYLPLYQGDCTVPPDNDEQEDDELPDPQPQPSKDDAKQPPSIGPFTRDQNYDRNSGKDGFTNEVPQKGLGPFTKEENIKIAKAEQEKLAAAKEYSDNSSKQTSYQSVSSPWAIAALANDGSINSNSVENNVGEFAERGRGFSSGSASLGLDRNGILQVITITSTSTTDNPSFPNAETHEPVLRLGNPGGGKKETGRSLKLPEITEPVLKPRGTRQDSSSTMNLSSRNGGTGDHQMEDRNSKQEMLEESPSSRGFTVQFLPERLAGILAQAERYARQTLLPLISQYTPSFIGGGRAERPKYFPPLGSLFGVRDDDDSGESQRKNVNDARTKYYFEFEEEPVSSTTLRTKFTSVSTSTVNSVEKKDDWVPLTVQPLQVQQQQVGESRKEKSMEGVWMNEGGATWSPRSNESDTAPETKIDDWVPITPTGSPKPESSASAVVIVNSTSISNNSSSSSSQEQDRKFIPLIDFADSSPKSEDSGAEKKARSIVFPYVYERKNDPRTRYIPLIPEEDLGIGAAHKEKER